MNTLHTDRPAVMVYADEIAEGDTIAITCTHRGPQIRGGDGTLTGYAACRALATPHQARQHYLTIERLRQGSGLLRSASDSGRRSGGVRLWRWSETASLLKRGGVR